MHVLNDSHSHSHSHSHSQLDPAQCGRQDTHTMARGTRQDGPQGHREPGIDLSHSIARMAQPLGSAAEVNTDATQGHLYPHRHQQGMLFY